MSKWMVFILLLFPAALVAQTVVLKQTVPEELQDEDDDFGPNRRHFMHPYMGYAFTFSDLSHQNESIPKNRVGSSFSIYSGSRYYKNYNGLLARTMDLEFAYEQVTYNTSKDSSFSLPVSKIDLLRARYWFVKLGGNFCFQVNFKPKRGNQLGTYLAFGAYANWIFMRRFVGKYGNDVNPNSDRTRVGLSNLDYIKNWEAGPMIRFGKTNWSLFAKFRYTDLIIPSRNEEGYLELPRLTVGINLFAGNI